MSVVTLMKKGKVLIDVLNVFMTPHLRMNFFYLLYRVLDKYATQKERVIQNKKKLSKTVGPD